MPKKTAKLTGEQVNSMVVVGALGENGRDVAMKMQENGALTVRSKRMEVKGATEEIQAIADSVWALLDKNAFTFAEAGIKCNFSLRMPKDEVEEEATAEAEETPEEAPAEAETEEDPF